MVDRIGSRPLDLGISEVGLGGTTLDEIKKTTDKEQVLSPDVAPQITAQAITLVGNAPSSSETLRLPSPDVPESRGNAQFGPLHQLTQLSNVMGKANGPVARSLLTALQRPPPGLTSQQIERMQASVTRERGAMDTVGKLTKMKQDVYGKMGADQAG